MCRCIIITSYLEGNLSGVFDFKKNDFILCADNGYEIASSNHILPDLIIGDFDSLTGPLPEHIETIKLPVEKDVTDTLACVKYAINNGFKEIIVLGGIGGRLDHTMANLQCLLYGISRGVSMEIRDNKNIVSLHFPSTITIKKKDNFKISLFSFSTSCDGITTKGLKYQLSNSQLSQGFPLGVSNEFVAEKASIFFKSGILLLILSKD